MTVEEQIKNTDEAESDLGEIWECWERAEGGGNREMVAFREIQAANLYAIARALIEIAYQGREKEGIAEGERWQKEHEEVRQFCNMPPLMESNEEIQALLDFIDIVALVGEYVDLERMGSDHRGLCPFHGGKTKSFAVIPKQQMYYCFVCHEGGNAAHFLMNYHKITLSEVLQRLRERRDGIAEMEPMSPQSERYDNGDS